MSSEIPERYIWAADLLDVQPSDNILEIGCGYGHLVGLVCERLKTGRIIAIDRSDTMVQAALGRNRQYIDYGKAEILHQDLLGSELPPAAFDKVLLFNINAFWMDPVSELSEVKRMLRSDGEFFIFHQPPPGHEIDEFVDRFSSNLKKNEFEIISAKVSVVEGKEMTCVISRPSLR